MAQSAIYFPALVYKKPWPVPLPIESIRIMNVTIGVENTWLELFMKRDLNAGKKRANKYNTHNIEPINMAFLSFSLF